MGMKAREKRERREQLAAVAWSMAASGDRLDVICLMLQRHADEVWRLLDLHQRRLRNGALSGCGAVRYGRATQ